MVTTLGNIHNRSPNRQRDTRGLPRTNLTQENLTPNEKYKKGKMNDTQNKTNYDCDIYWTLKLQTQVLDKMYNQVFKSWNHEQLGWKNKTVESYCESPCLIGK